ncbi:redoxin domain-containing protein [Methylobrevis albus]|uniref:Redoxin domain-containing protein n=1 Tax=Methylobrevis albus TaxID=2793297 RepID=A0A931N088_9HYPH|nr:redoxin domain-containing protein [Methylobrevis albus]MBH0238929.1 redoxin domain-containing protein [Methylobrevis albus]
MQISALTTADHARDPQAGEVSAQAPAVVAARLAAAAIDRDAFAGRGPLTLPVLEDRNDRPLDLNRRFADRRVLVVFYLGGWSEACTEALRLVDRARPLLDERCCSVVGISPESVDHLGRTADTHGLELTLLHDHGARFADAHGLAFRLPPPLRATLRAAGVRLPAWNGDASAQLPLPVTLLADFDRSVTLFAPSHPRENPGRGDVACALDAALGI